MKSLLLLLLALLPLAAAEPSLGDQLRDALYTEEVTRDPAKAAEAYAAILADFDLQRPLAASALFRLAEIRRAQGENDVAIALYQRLLQQFPEFEAETKLAREHLVALGGEIPTSEPAVDPNQEDILRLRKLAETAPDVFRDRNTLMEAATSGKLASVRFLLENGSDPNAEEVLARVASSGFLDVAKLLFAHGCKPNESDASIALTEAIMAQRTSMLAYLLEQGLGPNSLAAEGKSVYRLPILAAIERQEWEAAKLLAKHGLDPNQILDSPDSPPNTLLNIYAKSGSLDALRFLLENGADPNLTPPGSEITPLVTAAESANTEVIALLLKNGANPKQPVALNRLLDAEEKGIPGVRLLLEAGCDPNDSGSPDLPPIAKVFDWDLQQGSPNAISARHQKQVELIKLMLAHGADSNATGGSYFRQSAHPQSRNSKFLTDRSPFLPAQRTGEDIPESLLLKVVAMSEKQHYSDVHLIDTLLEAGAEPGAGFPEIFTFVARSSEDIAPELAKKLLPFRPNELHTEVDDIFFNWHPGVKRLFLNEVLHPEFASRGGIHVVLADTGSSLELLPAGNAVPETHRLLLDHLAWLSLAYRDDLLPTATVVRRDESGGWSRTPFDLAAMEPLPSLQQGDIIELAPEPRSGNEVRHGRNGRRDSVLWWNLQRRIVVPITVETDGQTRPITLRGDCLLYDPTSDIVPLLPSDRLAPLLWNIGYPINSDFLPRIIVTRKDWGEIPIAWNAQGFNLAPGDRLRLDFPEGSDDYRQRARFNMIQLVVPGTPFALRSAFDSDPERRDFAPVPTLAALLAEAWLPVFPHPSDGDPELSKLAWQTQNEQFPSSPPHPDFSKIRIHRMIDDQPEEILEVDLTKAIEACSDETTPEEARKSDIALLPGDIVELSLLENDEPYRGFSPEQNRYFKKVLSGSLQVFPSQGAPFLAKIDWQPLEWLATDAGVLPFASAEGTSGTRPRNSPGSEPLGKAIGNPQTLSIERDGSRSTNCAASSAFLRDQDRVYLIVNQPRTPPPRVEAPPIDRQPRPRVVAPPSR